MFCFRFSTKELCKKILYLDSFSRKWLSLIFVFIFQIWYRTIFLYTKPNLYEIFYQKNCVINFDTITHFRRNDIWIWNTRVCFIWIFASFSQSVCTQFCTKKFWYIDWFMWKWSLKVIPSELIMLKVKLMTAFSIYSHFIIIVMVLKVVFITYFKFLLSTVFPPPLSLRYLHSHQQKTTTLNITTLF